MVSAIGFSQVEFTAKLSKDKIGINERLRIDFEMNENGDNFVPPDFKDFRVYGGPRQSISQSWINGKRRFSKTYTYYLEPLERGTFTIGQAEVTIDGEVYKTASQEVEVVAAVDEPKDGDDNEVIDISKDVHVIAEVSNANPYLGEGISVVYKLYVSQNASVSNWRAIDIPKFANFWSQDIEIKDYKIKYGSYKGKEDYRYVTLKETVLYPQKSGELKIEPLAMSFAVEVPTNRKDFFGRPLYETIDKTLASNSLTIDVQPLPEQGKPADFTGAVGNFNFSATPSKTELEADEAMDLTLEAKGNGNLKLFQLPKFEPPRTFETYDPEHADQTSTNLNGMRGGISDTYTLIPSAKGKYTIDPIRFSYFDPQAEEYKTIQSDKIEIDVKSGPAPAVAQSEEDADTASGVSAKRAVVTSDKHFQYVKLRTKLQPVDKSPFFKSKLFWSLLVLPVVLLPVIILLGRKQEKRANDLLGKRIKKADRLARRYLSEAKKTIGDQEAYYNALEAALHNYLRAKLDIPISQMSKDRIEQILMERKVDEDTSHRFIELWKSCEFARYAPSSEAGMQQDYDKAAEIISEVDKQLK